MSTPAAARPARECHNGVTMFVRAKRNELGVLKPLYRSAFNVWARSLGRNPGYSNYEWLVDCVDEGSVWVAKNGRDLLGAMTLAGTGDTWRIDEIAVSPLRQGHGIGSWMLARATQLAPEHGIKRLVLCTAEKRRDLLDWYGRSGFSIVRETQVSHYLDGQVRVCMEKRLS